MNTKPPEGHPDELTWLRGFEAGVLRGKADMRREIDDLRFALKRIAAGDTSCLDSSPDGSCSWVAYEVKDD